ncbi:MAG TPA: type I pullulanase [Verrucomicrobiae bacterium]|nr:type I pullulanase [Verrucomicrobiae bacterium]
MKPDHFTESYVYTNDDLGAVYHPEATSVKLWAPTAKQVRLLLFQDATNESFQTIPMSRDSNGIWSADLAGDMDGKYYLYEVTFLPAGSLKPTIYRVNDPYARGCSANSGRTLIYDPRKTNPEGWDQDHFVTLKNNTEAVLYEVHIRDFSINTNSGIADGNRGKYLGVVQPGTKTPGGEASGLDHLKELGVTHVHLLPCFDYAGGDERQKADQYTWYDWGYDPVLYNTPEGSYASNPDGTARQKEFKEMVQAFHRNHIGVVMDVVYNHTAATGAQPASIFDKVFPGYYYRMDKSGHYANGTGCGNELASEKPMVRKFIVDSVKYWMTEYHVDGFRFDLMGILDRETMLAVYREAKKINPDAIIYGEGWQMERVLPADEMMTQAYVQGTGIAAFNDGIRDNIKGDYAQARDAGFVQGAGPPFGGMARFELEIKGQSTGKERQDIEVFSPNETINYDSAHDDLCLWDKLRLSAPDAPEALRINMDKLAAGIVLTAQGVPFIHAGDEFLRSKNLNPNSNNDNDPRVNPIDWSLKDRHKEVFNFYRGMIALRRGHPAFRMTDRARVNKVLEFATAVPANVVEYVLKHHANGDDWKTILVIYNGNPEPKDLTVTGNWAIVANDQTAGTETLATVRNKIRVAPFSLVVAHTDGAYQLDANN